MKTTFKKSISIFISIIMILSSLPFATMSASAADTWNDENTGLMHYTDTTNRLGDYYCIINDHNGTNTRNYNVAFWQYNISTLSGKHVNNATFKIQVATNKSIESGCSGLSFYSTLYGSKITTTNATNSTLCPTSGTGTEAADATKKAMKCQAKADKEFSKTDLENKKSGSDHYLTVDVTKGINRAIDSGLTYYTLIALQPTTSTNNWSDVNLLASKSSRNLSIESTKNSFTSTNYKEACKNISNFSVKQGTSKVSFQNAIIDNSIYGSNYNNVLYHDGNFSWGSEIKFSTPSGGAYNNGGKIVYPKNIVLLYDGNNDSSFPIRWQYFERNGWTYKFFYLSSNTQGLKLNDYWYGYSNTWNQWGYYNQSNINNSNVFSKISSNSSTTTALGYAKLSSNTSDGYNWTNLMHIDSSNFTFNSDNYYIFKDGIYCKGEICDCTGSGGESTHVNAIMGNKDGKIYVVNVKPIYDYAATAYNTLINLDTSKYTATSINAYCDKLSDLKNFDPTSFTYSSDQENNIKKCTKAMQDKIDACNTAYNNLVPQYTVKFVRNGTTINTQSVGKGSKPTVPENTPDSFNGYDASTQKATYTHYYWNPAVVEVTGDATYTEVATNHNCVVGTTKYTPHNGDVKGYTTYIDKDHSNFTWNVESNVDWTKLDTQITSAEAIKGIENYDTIYNETSRNTLNTAYTTATTLSNGETADTTQDEVDSANSALETAIKNMVLQYNIKFVRNDKTLSETYYDINTPAESIVIPQLTADHFNGKNETDNGATYTTYFWNPTISNVTQTATYTENSKVVDCTPEFVSYEKHTSTSNGFTTYKDSLHADDNTFTWTVDSDVDWSAYDSAITVSELMAQDTKKYTTDSISTFKQTVNDSKIAEDQNTTQQDVETATSNILSAQEKLELNKFTVTFNCQYDDQSGSTQGIIDSIETPTDGKYSYGTTITLKLPESFANDGVVQKWTLTNKDKTIQYSSCSTTVSYVVTQDCEFLANVTKAPQDPTESAKVEIKNKNDKVTDIQYVKTEEEYPVTIADRVITINTDKDTQTTSDTDVTMTAPKYPYYKVSGFKIGGEVVKENDKIKYVSTKNDETGEVTTTAQIIRDNEIIEIADTTIKPIYEVDTEATKIIIKNIGENPFTVKVANQETTLEQNGTLECEWDKKVVVHADDAKVWYDGDKIVGYGDTYTFQSNVAVNLKYTTEEKTVDPSTSIESFTYDLYNDKTVAIVGSYILPENATKKEMGVILSTKVSAQDQIISLGKKYVLTKETDNHQFFFTISRTANTPFTMYAVSYVTYELNGETKTVYSNVNMCQYFNTTSSTTK